MAISSTGHKNVVFASNMQMGIEFLLREAKPGDAVTRHRRRQCWPLARSIGRAHRSAIAGVGDPCELAIKPVAARLAALGVELRPGVSLQEFTSLGIGGTTDLLLIRRYENLPAVIRELKNEGIAYKFLGGGTNVLVADGELPWIMLQLPSAKPGVRVEGNSAFVDAAADLGGTVTFCAKNNLGGMEGLIGVPGSIGGALRMNAGAYGTQIGSYVREVELYRARRRRK